jgi:hypothetical protein
MEADVVTLEDQRGDDVTSLSFTIRNVGNATGTPSHKSIVYANGFIFYWTKSGIEVIDGYRGRNITSQTISPLWGWNTDQSSEVWYADRINMSKLEQVAGVYDRKEERIYWAYPSGTGTENDRVLCLDLRGWQDSGLADGVFSIWTGIQISTWMKFDGEGDEGEIFGGNADTAVRAHIYRLPYKDEDNVGDSGADAGTTPAVIDVDVRLGLTDGGRPDLLKSWRSVNARGRGGTASLLTMKYAVDDASASALGTTFDFSGTAAKRINSAVPRTAIGTSFGVEFQTADTLVTDQGPSPGFELYSVGVEYSEKRSRVRPHLA